MTFTEFWRSLSPKAKTNLMNRTGLPMSTLSGISTGKRGVGIKTANRLRRDNRITRDMLNQLNPGLDW